MKDITGTGSGHLIAEQKYPRRPLALAYHLIWIRSLK